MRNSQFKSRFTVVILSFTFLVFLSPETTAVAANNKIGVRVSTLPETKPLGTQPYAYNSKLWFVATKNETITRTIWIQDIVNSPQIIKLSIGAASNLDGRITRDLTRQSEIKNWVSFSDNNFQLESGGQRKVRVTLVPPRNKTNYSQDAMLIVSTVSPNAHASGKSNSRSKFRVVLPIEFQYAVPLFFGIGNLENLVSFNITDINGYLDGQGKYLEIKVVNDGISPIEPDGNVQLKLADFQGKTFGPYKWKVPNISPKSDGYLIARVPEEIMPARYESLIQAQFGSFADSKIITKQLDFKPKSNFGFYNFLAIFLGLVIVLAFARRQYRESFEKAEYLIRTQLRNIQNKAKIQSKWKAKNRSKKNTEIEIDDFDLEISIFLDRVMKSTAKKSTAKKSTARKSTARKGTAKK